MTLRVYLIAAAAGLLLAADPSGGQPPDAGKKEEAPVPKDLLGDPLVPDGVLLLRCSYGRRVEVEAPETGHAREPPLREVEDLDLDCAAERVDSRRGCALGSEGCMHGLGRTPADAGDLGDLFDASRAQA